MDELFFLLGRIIFGGYFIMSGLTHFTQLMSWEQRGLDLRSAGSIGPKFGELVGAL